MAYVVRSDAMAGVAIDCRDYDMPSEVESLWDIPKKREKCALSADIHPDEAVVEGIVTINVFYDASRDGSSVLLEFIRKGWDAVYQA